MVTYSGYFQNTHNSNEDETNVGMTLLKVLAVTAAGLPNTLLPNAELTAKTVNEYIYAYIFL